MIHNASPAGLHGLLVEALYCDTMVLADEARSYAEDHARADAAALDPVTAVTLSCESLRVTTRLMYLMAWLLDQRAAATDERAASPLAPCADTEPHALIRLPAAMAELAVASQALYRRAVLLQDGIATDTPLVSPARALQQRLTVDLRG